MQSRDRPLPLVSFPHYGGRASRADGLSLPLRCLFCVLREGFCFYFFNVSPQQPGFFSTRRHSSLSAKPWRTAAWICPPCLKRLETSWLSWIWSCLKVKEGRGADGGDAVADCQAICVCVSAVWADRHRLYQRFILTVYFSFMKNLNESMLRTLRLCHLAYFVLVQDVGIRASSAWQAALYMRKRKASIHFPLFLFILLYSSFSRSSFKAEG